MPHVEGQLRQTALHLRSLPIPTEQRLHGKTVPQIVNARPSALFVPHASGDKKLIDRRLQAGVAVGMKPTAMAIAQERRAGMNRKDLPPSPQIGLEFARVARGQRNQARLAELRLR